MADEDLYFLVEQYSVLLFHLKVEANDFLTIIIFFIATPQCTESLMSIHHMLQALRYFDWKQPLSVARYDKSYIFLLNYFTLF